MDYENNSEGFGVRDMDLSRGQLETRRHARMMKESCTMIEDDDEAVQCFTVAQRAEQQLDEVFRSEESQERMDRVREEQERTIDLSI